MKLIEPIAAEAAAIQTLRRDIHAHPELGFQEQRTSDLIAKTLSGWGIPVHRGLGRTGVVGIIKNGDANRAVGLRADMDGGHGEGPCMLHNASYDFNDELIPLGGSMWVRLAEKWLGALL
jgi:metal-dependent amidase/aminoacylase/carboxypeptidase family protein